jgi:hypothetical protein
LSVLNFTNQTNRQELLNFRPVGLPGLNGGQYFDSSNLIGETVKCHVQAFAKSFGLLEENLKGLVASWDLFGKVEATSKPKMFLKG